MPDREYVPLGRRFFARPATALARALLGRVLVHDSEEGRTAGIIVETEAYDESEPASHSSHGRTPRTLVMFGPPGFAYIYFSHGVHWCMNVVAGRAGHGGAVLLRALEPIEGLELMAKRRGLSLEKRISLLRLARGPGNLTQAMAIGRSHNGADLCAGPLRVMQLGRARPRLEIAVAPRVGITKAVSLPWRFYVEDSPFVSGRR